MTSAATPEWAELLQLAVAAQLFEVHTSMPGQVVAVHADDKSKLQFVDVRPCLRRMLETGDASAEPFTEEELPTLPRVPVGYMQGGGFFVSVPLHVGDFVTLVFAERSIDRWIATASKARQAAVSTGDVGMHTLDGAIALPMGPAPSGELLEGVSATDLVIGGPAGVMLRVTPDGQMRLAEGVTGESYVALASKVDAEFTRVHDELAALKGAISDGLNGVGVGTAASGTLGSGAFALSLMPLVDDVPTPFPSSPSSVAAAKVKAR
jgi:hypothetical protein